MSVYTSVVQQGMTPTDAASAIVRQTSASVLSNEVGQVVRMRVRATVQVHACARCVHVYVCDCACVSLHACVCVA